MSQRNILKTLKNDDRKAQLFELYNEKIPFIPGKTQTEKSEKREKLMGYLDNIVEKDQYKNLIKCCEIKGGTFSLQSIIMSALLKGRLTIYLDFS